MLDPFGGGSVRGIVASKLGGDYTGIDLRAEQIDANRMVQAEQICGDTMPKWVCGDSGKVMPTLAKPGGAVPRPSSILSFRVHPTPTWKSTATIRVMLSTFKYKDFRAAYAAIIASACALLKADRFACFVVGDVRDRQGFYRNFPGHTIEAFEAAGLRLYNEAILVTAVGSLPIRAGKQFATTRKLGKTHQQAYIFCKGDPREATEAIGEVEFGDIEPGASEAADVRSHRAMTPPVFREHERILVVRDDLYPGGTKARFLRYCSMMPTRLFTPVPQKGARRQHLRPSHHS